MSSSRVSYIRKRRSDDESSDSDSEDEAPPIKKIRRSNGDTNFKQILASKLIEIVNWISELPIKSYFKETMLKKSLLQQQPVALELDDDEEEIDVIDIADDEEEDDVDAVEKDYPCLSDKRSNDDTVNINSLFMSPLLASTPFYKDHKTSHGGSLNSLSRKPVNGFHNESYRSKDEKQFSHLKKSRYNQQSAPITNPGVDVEILLDTREMQAEESDDLEIVSEVAYKKPDAIPKQRMSTRTHNFGATSKDFNLQASFPSDKTIHPAEKSPFNKSYTAHEVVRLQEKAQYQLLLDKIVNGSTYRPVLSTKVTRPVEVQVDLTQDEEEELVLDSRHKREVLEQPVNEFLQKYYKPSQSKTTISPSTIIDHKNLFTDDKDDDLQVVDVKIPHYTRRIRKKPDFFSSSWITELKNTITAETEHRLQLVSAQEQKLERYRLRREGRQSTLTKNKPLPATEEFPEITPAMEAIIADAFDISDKDPLGEVSKIDDCACNWNDLLTLSGLNWLNDCVINFYLKLIKKRNDESLGKLPAIYVCSSYFYTALKNKGEKHVMRWTRKQDIFKFDLMFVPLHFGVHWALCVIDFRFKTIKYYDSMHGVDDDCLKSLLRFLVAEMKGKKNEVLDPDSYSLEIVKDIPQQMNGSDCGMFTLKYAEYISRDAPITFTQEHMQYFRRRMVVEIVEQELFN
ncbi:hypothetical protein NPIL_459761 [Nephila pilipes]|uniref:Ubiquitin-like protease family profile domain-containing protein n=1 Tax=Nephila pilipes TaxID=299642 RepID=A0A8X6QV20_NEPPI|nr:hypothetical protein NPIL_459761 [Nephila pilipes]